MNMKIGKMETVLGYIKMLEQVLMRELTGEEKDKVLEDEKKFLSELELTEEEMHEIVSLFKLISAYYTADDKTFAERLKECNTGCYITLRSLVEILEMSDKDVNEREIFGDLKEKQNAENIVEEFANFLQNLYNNLPKSEGHWFNNLTDKIRKDLFEIYKKEKNVCTNNELSGVITDTVKDKVIEDLVRRLNNKEEVDMTVDEYLEVVDYLTKNQSSVCIMNNNGKVKLF